MAADKQNLLEAFRSAGGHGQAPTPSPPAGGGAPRPEKKPPADPPAGDRFELPPHAPLLIVAVVASFTASELVACGAVQSDAGAYWAKPGLARAPGEGKADR